MPRYDKECPTLVELRLLLFQGNWHYNSYTAHYFWWKKRFLATVMKKLLYADLSL